MERVASSWRAHRGLWIGVGVAAVALAAAVVYWFGPQHLLIDRRADEALPTASVAADSTTGEAGGAAGAGGEGGAGGGDGRQGAPVDASTVATGSFVSLAHETTGEVRIVELEDGRRFLRIESLDTLSGPDLRVYLTSAQADGDPGAFDDELVVDLGGLRANTGNLTYPIPQSVDLTDVRSVSIWCRRFSVGFGAAPLVPAD